MTAKSGNNFAAVKTLLICVPARTPGMRPELAEINHKQVGVGGWGGDLSEEKHPCHLNAHPASEGGASVEVGPSRLLKARSDLGKAAVDHRHSSSGQEHGQWAELPDETGDGGRESEYAAADYGIYHQRGEAPAADRADEVMTWMVWRRFRHCVFLS
jgi:hypothetical protein